jgi:hypothetical protein
MWKTLVAADKLAREVNSLIAGISLIARLYDRYRFLGKEFATLRPVRAGGVNLWGADEDGTRLRLSDAFLVTGISEVPESAKTPTQAQDTYIE